MNFGKKLTGMFFCPCCKLSLGKIISFEKICRISLAFCGDIFSRRNSKLWINIVQNCVFPEQGDWVVQTEVQGAHLAERGGGSNFRVGL